MSATALKQSVSPKAGSASRVEVSNLGGAVYRGKVKHEALIMFTTQLSVMLDAGVVLSDALDAIASQAEEPLRQVIGDVADRVKSGENFSRSLAVYPRIFNSMFISMVRASEASGRMAEMLQVLSGYLGNELETRKKIKGAMTYPIIMALMAVAATGTLMFFVLPRFMKIYESRGASLPKITQLLVAVSNFIGDIDKLTWLLTCVITIGGAIYMWMQTASGRRVIDYIKIHIPIVGTMFIDTVVTRSMRIMATMVNTGVSLLDAVDVIESSCNNYYFQRLWREVDRKIRDGYQLSEAIQLAEGAAIGATGDEVGPSSGELIAPGIIQMLKAGEKSGRLGDVSDKISIFYEKKLDASIRAVMSLIEPVMITVLGAIIGTVAIALLLPVFRISTVVAQ